MLARQNARRTLEMTMLTLPVASPHARITKLVIQELRDLVTALVPENMNAQRPQQTLFSQSRPISLHQPLNHTSMAHVRVDTPAVLPTLPLNDQNLKLRHRRMRNPSPTAQYHGETSSLGHRRYQQVTHHFICHTLTAQMAYTTMICPMVTK